MFTPSRPFVACAALVVCALLVAFPVWQRVNTSPPDFTLYPAGDVRKAVFFGYLGPIIDRENERRRARRDRLLALKEGLEWSKRDRIWVEELANFYGVDTELHAERLVEELLVHVDTIPKSLALAQAAKESAWGTSRFAIEGNSYFGQRCYSKGCGMVPEARPPGARFEVKTFDSVEASVASYMNNINGHQDYAGLRFYRAERRHRGKPLTGIQAAERLSQYSERRRAYVDEIQALIHFNGLEDQE